MSRNGIRHECANMNGRRPFRCGLHRGVRIDVQVRRIADAEPANLALLSQGGDLNGRSDVRQKDADSYFHTRAPCGSSSIRVSERCRSRLNASSKEMTSPY